jgi:hypothetical protein
MLGTQREVNQMTKTTWFAATLAVVALTGVAPVSAQLRPDAPPQQRPDAPPQQRPDAPPQQRPDAPPQQRPDAPPQQRPDAARSMKDGSAIIVTSTGETKMMKMRDTKLPKGARAIKRDSAIIMMGGKMYFVPLDREYSMMFIQ